MLRAGRLRQPLPRCRIRAASRFHAALPPTALRAHRILGACSQVIAAQGGFECDLRSALPLRSCLADLPIRVGSGGGSSVIRRLEVFPDRETGARCVHQRLVEHTLEGACRALHEGAMLAVPPAVCFACARHREKLNGLKRKVEVLRQRHVDDKGSVDVQRQNFVLSLKQSKKLTRCPFCETAAIHTNACDHMQCVNMHCRKHYCRGCSLNKWLLELGAQVEDRYIGREGFLRSPRNYGGDSAGDVYERHLYNAASSCNQGASCFNPEARRQLLPGEEAKLIAASAAYGTALEGQGHGVSTGSSALPPARSTATGSISAGGGGRDVGRGGRGGGG